VVQGGSGQVPVGAGRAYETVADDGDRVVSVVVGDPGQTVAAQQERGGGVGGGPDEVWADDGHAPDRFVAGGREGDAVGRPKVRATFVRPGRRHRAVGERHE